MIGALRDLIEHPVRFHFFIGKGGVGKTSLACGTAVGLADRGPRTLLVSTDPASNLDAILGIALGNTPLSVPGVPNLLAMNIDPDAAARDYRERTAAAIAIALADRGRAVLLTTTDPAAHVTETLTAAIPGLTVSRIDPIAEARRYRDETYASKAPGLDAEHRALLHEELQSPCYDEIAFFVAFSKIVVRAKRELVVGSQCDEGGHRHAPPNPLRRRWPKMRLDMPFHSSFPMASTFCIERCCARENHVFTFNQSPQQAET